MMKLSGDLEELKNPMQNDKRYSNRIAFTMQLVPGTEAEYQRRHDEIWPELSDLLKAAGIEEYSI
jgi:hypothetical protein